MPPSICSPARAKALPRSSRARPRATLANIGDNAVLNDFMGFIATLVQTSSHSHPRSSLLHTRHSSSADSRSSNSNPHVHTDHPESDPPISRVPQRRGFHNYFVTHLPSSSLHPDPRLHSGPHHKLPRSASTPHTPGPGSSPAASPPNPNVPSRDLTVVRIPLRSAKHHFGAYNSRGTRPYNEDTNQAGTIDLPAFARRAPVSLVRSAKGWIYNPQPYTGTVGEGENKVADSPSGDPQIFYFGVFDGHGGSECSEFLRDELHGYIEAAAVQFGLGSSLRKTERPAPVQEKQVQDDGSDRSSTNTGLEIIPSLQNGSSEPGENADRWVNPRKTNRDGAILEKSRRGNSTENADLQKTVPADVPGALRLEGELISEYKNTVGGYFRRFRPAHFSIGQSSSSLDSTVDLESTTTAKKNPPPPVTIESVLTYAFLRADLDFIKAQARKPDPDDPYVSDFPLNKDEVLGAPQLPPSGHGIGGPVRFKGGSTASISLISTPTPMPFWHPAAQSTLMVAHVGDTRVLLCETATGRPRALTSDHHPSSPTESRRLRRFAADSFAIDSFGEERFSGLANSRAFGDMQSKRVGVSAEPEICRTELGPAEFSFLVLTSDGVSGTLSDQEIVDVVKEAKTPEQGSKDVVEYATEVSANGDNATCLVVRLGGWERRSEGGLGSMGTKEIRDARRAEALDPRRGRR